MNQGNFCCHKAESGQVIPGSPRCQPDVVSLGKTPRIIFRESLGSE